MWEELDQEFPAGFDQYAEQTLWNETRDMELRRPLTQIAHDRLWNKRPDGIAFKMTTKTRSGVVCLLEFKCLLDRR